MSTQMQRAEQFKELHEKTGIFALPNPWDAGSAKLLTQLGFAALATTSAGLAFALGRPDGEGAVTRAETLENARAIVEATPLPVTADLENGFGDSPETCAETIHRLEAFAAAGADVLYAPGLKCREEIAAVVAAVAPKPVNVLMGMADAQFSLAELEALGVKRVSVGSALARAAYGAFLQGAREMRDRGAFSFVERAAPFAETNAAMRETGDA